MVSRELLDLCRRGDPGAFEELVERTRRRVYALAYRLVGDRHEAEDVAQEAYLRVFRSLGGFRGEAGFDTWLHRVVTSAAFTHLKRRGRFGALLANGGELVGEEPEERRVERTLERDEVRRALDRLSPALRVVTLLKDVYGLSVKEIAQEIGIAEGAVKVRLHRARRQMRDVLKEPAR